jgi:hypothetical protein
MAGGAGSRAGAALNAGFQLFPVWNGVDILQESFLKFLTGFYHLNLFDLRFFA